MIFWALIGLVVCGLTMGVIGSGLTVNTQPPKLQIYGTPVSRILSVKNQISSLKNHLQTHQMEFKMAQ